MNNPVMRFEADPSLDREEQIDLLCDAFEQAWNAGQQPRIEDYLAQLADSDRPRLLRNLLGVELQLRQAAGETPKAQEYHERFPADEPSVRHAFEDVVQRHTARNPRGRVKAAGGSTSSADRNLLFGVLALQNDFISREELIAAVSVWLQDKSKPLAEILLKYNALPEDEYALLSALVKKHLERHGNDPEKSLAAVSTLGTSIQEELTRLGDADVEASLVHLASGKKGDDLTATQTIGDSTSRGKRFRILRPHAKGGLGEVSVAFDGELNREVALKEIQPQHADHPDSQARFVQEAQITGGLEHPGIVPVYGLGQYADGRPFYAMRFIRGDSLKEAADHFHAAKDLNESERSLELRKLLGRFVDVCQAIEYAHSRGVLHRDLKPGNIMLGKYGETLVVDWGLGKPVGKDKTASPSDEPTIRPDSGGARPTQIGSAIGTPAFMSPEQAAGRLNQLGPVSDVYSLGATLYSLLTGRAPIADKDHFVATRKAQDGDFTRPRDVIPNVPRPLEAICLKAMSLDQAERYQSANELADEIERWLADEPVMAYRDPVSVRVGRWVRRHQTIVTATGAAVFVGMISLAAGLTLLTASNAKLSAANVREERAKSQAQRRFEVALEAIERYYTGASEDVLLKQVELSDLRNRLLRTALEFYEKLRGDVEVGEDLMTREALVKAYMGIGDITGLVGNKEDALAAWLRAVEIQALLVRAVPSNRDYQRELARCYAKLGVLQGATGKSRYALTSMEKAINSYQMLVAESPTVTDYRERLAECYNNLGLLQSKTRRLDDALTSYQKAIDIHDTLIAENPAVSWYRYGLATSYSNLANLQSAAGQSEGALTSYQQAIDIQETLVAASPTVTDYQNGLAKSYNNLGLLQSKTRNLNEALTSYQKAIDRFETLVAENPTVTEYLNNLAAIYVNLGLLQSATRGQLDDALTSFQKAIDSYDTLVTESPTVTDYRERLAKSYHNLGVLQFKAGAAEKAMASYQQALEIRNTLVVENPTVSAYQSSLAGSYNDFGNLQSAAGQSDDALRSYRKAIEIRETLVAENPAATSYRHGLATIYTNLAILQSTMGQSDGALASCQKAIDRFETLVAENPTVTSYQHGLATSYTTLANLQTATVNSDAALTSYQKAIEIQETLVTENPTVTEYTLGLGVSYRDIGNLVARTDPRDSLDWYANAVDTLQDVLFRDGRHLTAKVHLHSSYWRRATVLNTLERYEEAVADWGKTIELDAGAHVAFFRMQRCRSRALAGDHRQAIAETNELISGEDKSGTNFYNAACILSLSSRAAKDDTKLSEEERAQLSEQHAFRAVQLLRQAGETGYFNDSANVKHMRKDLDLHPIHSRDDVKKLIQELEHATADTSFNARDDNR